MKKIRKELQCRCPLPTCWIQPSTYTCDGPKEQYLHNTICKLYNALTQPGVYKEISSVCDPTGALLPSVSFLHMKGRGGVRGGGDAKPRAPTKTEAHIFTCKPHAIEWHKAKQQKYCSKQKQKGFYCGCILLLSVGILQTAKITVECKTEQGGTDC